MALDRTTALLICQVVAGDIQCRAILSGPNNSVLQAFGWSGGIRNFANAAAQTFGSLDQDDVQRESCIGISEVTTNAVFAASVKGSAKTGQPAPLPSVERAMEIDRSIDGWDHHACKVVMIDGSDYVFDWWKTLDPMNPWIYRTDDWRVDGDAVPFSSFSGYDLFVAADASVDVTVTDGGAQPGGL
jgi:hypothetical protein